MGVLDIEVLVQVNKKLLDKIATEHHRIGSVCGLVEVFIQTSVRVHGVAGISHNDIRHPERV